MIPRTCPRCGVALPEVVDAFCPSCREELPAPPPEPSPARSSAAGPPDHHVARALVWVFRGLALLTGIWGLSHTRDAVLAHHAAGEVARRMEGGPRLTPEVAAAVAQAGVTGVITSALTAVVAVAVLLAFAEGLRLVILIEGNTRGPGHEPGG